MLNKSTYLFTNIHVLLLAVYGSMNYRCDTGLYEYRTLEKKPGHVHYRPTLARDFAKH